MNSLTDRRPLALFDFDGTLTTRDSLLFFLFFVSGSPTAFLFRAVTCFPDLLSFHLGRSSNEISKQRILAVFLRNSTPADLKRARERILKILPKLLREKALARLRWHQSQGHECVLVSASPDIYLQDVATHLKCGLICTEVDVGADNNPRGTFKTPNCHGPEKLKRVREHFGDLSSRIIYAYGDSSGDKEMLAVADYPFYRIFPPTNEIHHAN